MIRPCEIPRVKPELEMGSTRSKPSEIIRPNEEYSRSVCKYDDVEHNFILPCMVNIAVPSNAQALVTKFVAQLWNEGAECTADQRDETLRSIRDWSPA